MASRRAGGRRVGEQASRRSNERSIRRPKRGAARLPTSHDELMTQQVQLDVLRELASQSPDKQPKHGRERQIGKGKQHAPMLA